MIRLFSLLAVITVFMVVATGGGVYWLSNESIAQSKQDAANIKVKSLTLSLAAQIEQLNKTLDKMSQDPELLTAVITGDKVLLNNVTARLEHYLPYTLKIRVLFPGVSQLDESSAPRMGYADLDMVQKTFLNNEQLPFVQGDEGKDKHVAMTRRVIQNNKIVAVILASLSDSFIQKAIDLKSIDATEDNTIELKQDKRILIKSGSKAESESDEVSQFKIINTNWTLYYYYNSRANFNEIGMALIAVFAPLLLVLLAFALVQRKLSSLLAEDLESVTQACKDLLKEKAQGSYPTSLRETSSIIMELMQFKRILDSRKNDPSNYANTAATISGRADEFESVDVESFFDD